MNILRVAWADLRRIAKDRMALVWLFLMPLGMAFMFGAALRGHPPGATWIPVIDLDRRELSPVFAEQLRGEGCEIDVKGPEAQEELRRKWPYGVVIPAGFSQAILEGRRVKVALIKGQGSPEKILEVQTCLLRGIVRFTKGLAVAEVSRHPWGEASRAALREALARPQLLSVSRLSDRTLRPPPEGFSQSLPGMLVMFVLQMVLTYGGVTLVVDRAGGRLRRLLGTPAGKWETCSGKILARVLLGCGQAAVLLGAAAWIFRLPLGDHPLFLAPVVLSLALCAGALSAVAGRLCQTEKQVILLAIFGSMVFSAIGGCWWPIEIVPDSMKTAAMFTPSYWAMHGLQSVLYFGRSFQAVAVDCGALLIFTAAAGLAAALLWRRAEG